MLLIMLNELWSIIKRVVLYSVLTDLGGKVNFTLNYCNYTKTTFLITQNLLLYLLTNLTYRLDHQE